VTTVAHRGTGYVQRAHPTGLAEIVDLILDKGLVIDAYVRVSLVGIEVLTIDARIVIASVDTYLRFAEAVNRLDLAAQSEGLPEMIGDVEESGAARKTKGAIEGVRDKFTGNGDKSDDGDKDKKKEAEPARQRNR
jgi:hypothetical protein